ncbi:MAG TPA: DNA topoisomerase VI subunit B [Sedimentisphaerales bacterium]|nr:DNA topoisomerase VI subunit B [Sedimentisphaerales bacterium]
MATRKSRSAGQLSFAFEKPPAKKAEVRAKKAKPITSPKKRRKAKSESPPSEPRANTTGEHAAAADKQLKTANKRKMGAPPATAESMAAKQRVISVSEFFAKNRHLLGFDNPRKALLTAAKEAVDNSLDACEEAYILPELAINIKPAGDNKFVMTVKDNGPGIIRQQIPNIFARLLYGSKFHSLKMSRGQQGIGISAAGMYGLLTTGEPVRIISRTSPGKNAHLFHVQIDTAKNKPEVVLDEECDFDLPTGTSVTITLEGKYQKGRQSVDEYVAQTAMANPHAIIRYAAPDGNTYEYPRRTKQSPFVPRAIKPHPYGVELGLLLKMARESPARQLSAFLQKEFSRVSPRVAQQICEKAKLRSTLRPPSMTLQQAEALHAAISETRIMAPATDCIAPIGAGALEEGLKRVVEAGFYTACSRSPAVYRGNPFLIEAALAYGTKGDANGEPDREPLMRLIRIANRVPLLYQQSACAIYKSVMDVNWRNYALSQSKGALPTGPLVLMVHIASVWVPFTSESKEAIAHYPEIIREIQLAIQECGRKLGMFLRKRKRIQQEMDKRRYIETYLPYIGEALEHILSLRKTQVDTVVTRLKTVLERSRKL